MTERSDLNAVYLIEFRTNTRSVLNLQLASLRVVDVSRAVPVQQHGQKAVEKGRTA
jgi:hypothetical protein